MELIARVGDRPARVRVERNGEHLVVEVDGRRYAVDAVATSPAVRSLLLDSGDQHEIGVFPRDNGSYWVSSAGSGVEITMVDPLTHLAQQGAGGNDARRSRQVHAYMPGRVVALLAEEGATVRAGQGVLVLEAMKMENEIQAEHDGVVQRICVTEGEAVEGGDLLFELG